MTTRQKLNSIRKVFGLFSITILLIYPGFAFSAEYPTRSISLLVPYAAGGPVDITGRVLADIAKDILGQPVVLISKPGGGGIIAQSIVAKEKPDGYTLAITSDIAFTQIPQMQDVAFDPLKDFEFIVQHMAFARGIVCRADKPWKSMKDLVDYSKQHPGDVMYGAPGKGGSSHIAAEFIAAKERVKWRLVPYDGSIKVVAALLGGHVDFGISDMIWKDHVKAGELRILAITAMGRGEDFPYATTFEELGYEDVSVSATFGIVAPKGTPADIRKKLHDAFKRAIEDPRYESSCKKLGCFKIYSPGEEFLKQ